MAGRTTVMYGVGILLPLLGLHIVTKDRFLTITRVRHGLLFAMFTAVVSFAPRAYATNPCWHLDEDAVKRYRVIDAVVPADKGPRPFLATHRQEGRPSSNANVPTHMYRVPVYGNDVEIKYGEFEVQYPPCERYLVKAWYKGPPPDHMIPKLWLARTRAILAARVAALPLSPLQLAFLAAVSLGALAFVVTWIRGRRKNAD